MEGKGILLHKHSVALVDGEAKSPDPSILRYGEIAINYATDHETISIKNQNDEIATFKTHKLYTQLLGDKQDKTDDTLLTQDKTITGALNELKTDLDDSVEPYVVNLTNLLSANDSESISAAIGGIENLNSTISKNQVIFGVLATGTVAVGIRVFGNQTTLNYFVDSVLGLTINEIAITNTDNTLSKTVETHAVLTENMVINSLNSDETTLPLSAAQGKALDSKISGSAPYIIDGDTLLKDSPTSEEIDTAIGGWDNLVAAIQNNRVLVIQVLADISDTYIIPYCYSSVSGSTELVTLAFSDIIPVPEDEEKNLYPLTMLQVGKIDGNLMAAQVHSEFLTKDAPYDSLTTTNKTVLGAINELKSDIDSINVSADITNAINALDSSGQTTSTGEVISSVSQENGVISVSKKTLTSDDIPELPQSKITDLSTDLAAKQNATDNNLDTTDKTIVGAINEILPKATGVGKKSLNSNGSGEIFNSYEGDNANIADGYCSHAEGYDTRAYGVNSHAEGSFTQTFKGAEHAEGTFNKSYESDSTSIRVIHSVGIGSSDADRKNAHEIKLNGDHYVYGLGSFDGTNSADAQTLQEVINSKQDTITAGTGLEFEGTTLNVTLDTTVFKVVSVLPDSPAQGDENKIHLVSAEFSGANNTYTEYVWVNSTWEILGEYTSEVDLTPYLKTSDAESTYLKITDAASDYATKTELDTKQNATDDSLDTVDKTVVGAINEILSKATGVGKIDSTSDGTGEIFNDYSNNKASGRYAHAEGWSTTASGIAAHAEGRYTTASGNYAHAEGWCTTAHGNYAHAEGHNTIASMTAAHAEGFCNFDDSDAIHMVGIGTSDSDRKNAHVIKPGNGEHFIIGIGGYEGQTTDSAQSLQEVINGKQDALTRLDVSTLFADSATTTSELSSQIAAYGESTATDFPLMYAGDSIGNIKPTWIRTNAGVTNFMCIADNKIWYFEIQGTTVQRASLSIS